MSLLVLSFSSHLISDDENHENTIFMIYSENNGLHSLTCHPYNNTIFFVTENYQTQLDGLMSKLTDAAEMAQGLEERHNLAEEQHKSDTDSLQRRIDSLSKQAEKSQENVTSLRNGLLAGMWLS